jgi:hypothetical protein
MSSIQKAEEKNPESKIDLEKNLTKEQKKALRDQAIKAERDNPWVNDPGDARASASRDRRMAQANIARDAAGARSSAVAPKAQKLLGVDPQGQDRV